MKGKGIVVKAKDSHCIILTKDGTYVKVPASRVKNTQVGAESEFSLYNWGSQLRPLLMVASILIFVLGFGMYKLTATPAAAAYVSLDINPSVELEVDNHAKIIGTRAINGDAEDLLSGMQLKGKDLYASIREIVNKAAAKGYIKPNQTNYVLSSVTVEKNGADLINYDTVVKNLQDSVQDKELDVEFVVLSSDVATRNEAKSQGISAGKMLVYKNSVNAGEKLTIDQVKNNSLTNLVNTYKVKVLPNDKKAIVKLLHVPPHSQRFKKENRRLQDGNDSKDNNTLSADKEDLKWTAGERKDDSEENEKENSQKNNTNKNAFKKDIQNGLTESDASSKESQPETRAKDNPDQNGGTKKETGKVTDKNKDKDTEMDNDTDRNKNKETDKNTKSQRNSSNDKKSEKNSQHD